MLIRAADSRMPCCGTVGEWRVFPRSAGKVALQVWRETADPDILVLVGENIVDIRSGEEDIAQVVVSIALGDRISVDTGDYIAWYSSGQESIPFVGTAASHPVWRFTPSTALSVGSMLQLTGYDITADREFSIGAILAASVTPYFTNTVHEVTVYANATVSSIVYTVQYTDDDPGDIASLSVTMEISELFAFLSP
ncbi:hypothetical protein MAR_025474, partial [Mya arenaria]